MNLPAYEPKLSIESILQPGEIPKVYVSTSVPYFSKEFTPSQLFAKSASVAISSLSGTDILTADSTFNQYTCLWQPYFVGSTAIREDEQYSLHVEYGGEAFDAQTTTNIRAVSIDSVSYVQAFSDLYGEHEGVVVDFSDLPGEGDHYRYRMDRDLSASKDTLNNCNTGSYAAREIGRVIYSDQGHDGLPVRFVIEPAFKHKAGDETIVYVESLDKGSAAFFDELDKQKEAKINPFIEPIFLRSRIPGAIGVFGAAGLSAPIRFVYPE